MAYRGYFFDTGDFLKSYYSRFYDSFSEELFEKLHKAVELPMNKPLGTFSEGMKRQAAVICVCFSTSAVFLKIFLKKSQYFLRRSFLVSTFNPYSDIIALFSPEAHYGNKLCCGGGFSFTFHSDFAFKFLRLFYQQSRRSCVDSYFVPYCIVKFFHSLSFLLPYFQYFAAPLDFALF